MGKNVKQSRLFLESTAVFAVVLFSAFMLEAVSSTMSESLKDDVTAMITNAKKSPHTIFVIDSSESMNTFAYSDYIDTCKDGEGNIDKAIVLCNNAYQQCRNVESNAMCDVNLGCGDVSSKCNKLVSVKNQIHDFCTKVKNIYAEPASKTKLEDPESTAALKYVGPWSPNELYNDDLCFYDWSKDTDGNVLNGTTTAQGDMNTAEDKTDRRDWDCLTDGRGRMYNSDGTLGGTFSSVSGHWLNWKYTTSLDAVKIILADTHKFSYPPRYRGHNVCHKTFFYPEGSYSEWDETVDNGDGTHGAYVDGKTCFIDFDTEFSDITDQNLKKEQLNAMSEAILNLWRSEMKEPESDEKPNPATDDWYEITGSKCTAFTGNYPFSLPIQYGDDRPQETSPECDRCMEWDKSSKQFVIKDCSVYKGAAQPASDAEVFGSISTKLSKVCCKTTECDNPHCRDDDEVCQTCGEGDTECKSGDDVGCVLGYYSQFDQDKNHCCNALNCAEEGETEGTGECLGYSTDENGVEYCSNYECESCKSSVVVGEDEFSGKTEDKVVLPKPDSSDDYYGSDAEDGSINYTVVISSFTAGTDPSEIESVTVTVQYDCNGYNSEDSTKKMSKELGSLTLSGENAAECATLSCETWLAATCSPEDTDCLDNKAQCGNCAIQGTLSGCNDSGYVASAVVKIKRKDCHFSGLNTNLSLKELLGAYRLGKYEHQPILDRNKEFYQMFRSETSAAKKVVYEYECKTAFYHRQVLVRSGGSCPSAAQAPALLNAEGGSGTKIEYCDGRTAEKEVIARDQWFNATQVACSWQCRDAITYDEPWKCASFFYMMDDPVHNGSAQNCMDQCRFATGGKVSTMDGGSEGNYKDNNLYIEDCCKCLDKVSGNYEYLEKPEGVTLSNGQRYTCFVSGYQFGTAADGGTTTTSGYMAEIVRGHISETPSGGSYALEPYNNFYDSGKETPYIGWYNGHSLVGEAGEAFVKDTFISAFETANDAKRDIACIYDIMTYGWSGSDCDTSSCGGSGCCAVDLSQNSNECDYPQFWMKVPMSEGGQLIYQADSFSDKDKIEAFQEQIANLKAIGGATLGETLYDVWRYLGGMYAVHDPAHIKNGTNLPYESPYDNQDPACFTNEAVVISGGQPEFDHNLKLRDYGVTQCPSMKESSDSQVPCVSNVANDEPTKLKPYYRANWHQTSFLNVAGFVNNNTYWIKSGQDWCKDPNGSLMNNGKLKSACIETENNTGVNMARINRVHTISIGEWALAPLHSVTGSGTDDFLDTLYLKNAAEKTAGKYFGLTAENPVNAHDGSGGTFSSLTDLFSDMMQKSQNTDVVSGRPHWTSSLVQPFDVEEKYRGPDSYAAGAVPIDGSVSRFWFGNLKKYQTDGGDCAIADDDSDCGEWKKQSFPDKDCFGKDDSGSDFLPQSNTAVAQFKRLMSGGAAYRLEKMLKDYENNCSDVPCIGSMTKRKMYYDDGYGMQPLSGVAGGAAGGASAGSQLFSLLKQYDSTLTPEKANQILDYMAGYDAFDPERRKKIRYVKDDGTMKTYKVQDPINIDFNKDETKEITIRPLLLGAIVHSKPLAVHYNSTAVTRIYAGANDGMLHAFDQNGEEVYGYVPSNAFKSILSFGENKGGIFFNATVDGPITMLHIDKNHDGIINQGDAANDIKPESAYLIFGYRRGATGYTVIDISDPTAPGFVQNIPTGGYSFGKAVIFRKCLKGKGNCKYADDLDYYLAVPGGYDICNDPASLSTVASDNVPLCGTGEQQGNNFSIYHFNSEDKKFDSTPVFTSSKMEESSKRWLKTSFAATPLAINTSGKAAIDTEYVYFNDLSGTVFRVDVSSTKSSEWTGKVVYAQRNSEDLDWTSGISRSYVASNFFPPLEKYNPQKNDDKKTKLIPVPMVTGNAANPKLVERDFMLVFYDQTKDAEDQYETPFSSNYTINNDGTREISDTNLGGFFKSRGWIVSFGQESGITDGEKGITEPLITYNIYGGDASDENSNAYSIAWNTYIPKKATACKNFGTSSSYERLIGNGKQAFKNLSMTGANGEWSSARAGSECSLDTPNISLATGVGVIATDEGYDLTFGAGADIFRKRDMTVKNNKTYIIKWYELY